MSERRKEREAGLEYLSAVVIDVHSDRVDKVGGDNSRGYHRRLHVVADPLGHGTYVHSHCQKKKMLVKV